MSQIVGIRAALASTRVELEEALARLTEEMGDWAPSPGMRTMKGQLVEILVTEQDTVARIKGVPGSDPAQDEVIARLPVADLIQQLRAAREATLAELERRGELGLDDEVPTSEGFRSYLGLEKVTAGELFRHIVRHESYHCGQIVSCLWARGDNPYDWED